MGILKKVGIVLGALILLALLAAALMPKHFEYEFAEDMDASKETVYGIIGDLQTWGDWGPWAEEDPSMELTFGEKTSGEGASYSWESEKMGNGTMTITEVDKPNLQKGKLVFEGQGDAVNWFKLKDNDAGGTNLAWGMSYDAPWPFNLISVFQEGMMEEFFTKGLANVKVMAEKMESEKPTFKVSTVDFPGKTFVAMKETLKFGEMGSDFFATRYAKMGEALGKAKVEMTGQPCGLYFTWDEDNEETEMAAALPVATGKMVKGKGMEMVEVPPGKAYVIDYYGPYEDIGSAHYAMDDYLEANKLQAGAPVIEEYVTDPGTEPDPAKWLTKVYYLADNLVAENQ